MPTETLLPDALLEHSGWAGTPAIATIDEDPDMGGGDWLDPATASGAGSSSPVARVSFPTPTGPPTGVQTFKARLGLINSLGTSPTARIDLWENGALKATGATQTIAATSTKTLTGEVISQAFDLAATPLATANGSLVEARVVVTASAAGANSRSASLDSVNWDTVNYVLADTTKPIVNTGTISRTRISRVPERDLTTVTFTANEATQAMQVRLVPGETSPVAAGTLIEQDAVARAANATVTVDVTDDELVAAGGTAGDNIIKLFMQDSAGNWSDA